MTGPAVLRGSAIAVLAAVLLSGCAGQAEPTQPAQPARPAVDVGHGSVEEVMEALAAQGVPCTGPVPAEEGAFEQATTCTVEGTAVTLVHGARVGDADLARRMSAAILGTTHG